MDNQTSFNIEYLKQLERNEKSQIKAAKAFSKSVSEEYENVYSSKIQERNDWVRALVWDQIIELIEQKNVSIKQATVEDFIKNPEDFINSQELLISRNYLKSQAMKGYNQIQQDLKADSSINISNNNISETLTSSGNNPVVGSIGIKDLSEEKLRDLEENSSKFERKTRADLEKLNNKGNNIIWFDVANIVYTFTPEDRLKSVSNRLLKAGTNSINNKSEKGVTSLFNQVELLTINQINAKIAESSKSATKDGNWFLYLLGWQGEDSLGFRPKSLNYFESTNMPDGKKWIVDEKAYKRSDLEDMVNAASGMFYATHSTYHQTALDIMEKGAAVTFKHTTLDSIEGTIPSYSIMEEAKGEDMKATDPNVELGQSYIMAKPKKYGSIKIAYGYEEQGVGHRILNMVYTTKPKLKTCTVDEYFGQVSVTKDGVQVPNIITIEGQTKNALWNQTLSTGVKEAGGESSVTQTVTDSIETFIKVLKKIKHFYSHRTDFANSAVIVKAKKEQKLKSTVTKLILDSGLDAMDNQFFASFNYSDNDLGLSVHPSLVQRFESFALGTKSTQTTKLKWKEEDIEKPLNNISSTHELDLTFAIDRFFNFVQDIEAEANIFTDNKGATTVANFNDYFKKDTNTVHFKKALVLHLPKKTENQGFTDGVKFDDYLDTSKDDKRPKLYVVYEDIKFLGWKTPNALNRKGGDEFKAVASFIFKNQFYLEVKPSSNSSTSSSAE